MSKQLNYIYHGLIDSFLLHVTYTEGVPTAKNFPSNEVIANLASTSSFPKFSHGVKFGGPSIPYVPKDSRTVGSKVNSISFQLEILQGDYHKCFLVLTDKCILLSHILDLDQRPSNK